MAALRSRRAGGKPPPFRLTSYVPAEHQAQIDCTRVLLRILRPGVCFTAIDHANARDATAGAIRKARGVRPGIPDYLFWDDGKGYAIEFKVEDGDLTDSQKIFLPEMIAAGVQVKVCWNAGQVFDTVYRWGLVRPGVRIEP